VQRAADGAGRGAPGSVPSKPPSVAWCPILVTWSGPERRSIRSTPRAG
jgi:hypothetical protein